MRGSGAAAAILHAPEGNHCHGGSIVASMTGAMPVPTETGHGYRLEVTAGMMELAGIAISLQLCTNYMEALDNDTDIAIYCDNEPIVGFAVQGGEADAGAPHLEPLGTIVQSTREGLLNHRCVGLRIARPDDGRRASNIRRADAMAAAAAQAPAGFSDPWPNGVAGALREGMVILSDASPRAYDIMRRFF